MSETDNATTDLEVPIAGQEAFAPVRLRKEESSVSKVGDDGEAITEDMSIPASTVRPADSWSRTVVNNSNGGQPSWAKDDDDKPASSKASSTDEFTTQRHTQTPTNTRVKKDEENHPTWLDDPKDQKNGEKNSAGYTPPIVPGTNNTEKMKKMGTSFKVPSTFKGVEQDEGFQDVLYGVLFWLHMGLIIFLGVKFAHYVDLDVVDGIWTLLLCISICAISAILISSIVVGLMIRFPKLLIKGSLFFCICVSLGFGIFSVVTGHIIQALIGFISFSLSLAYTKISWKRITFAATNLATALSALRDNVGLLGVAYSMMILAFGWSTFWAITAAGSMAAFNNWYILLVLIPSYYWVDKVLKNIVHVTSAGTIGAWWFTNDEEYAKKYKQEEEDDIDGGRCCLSECFCNVVIAEYLLRSWTYSFGSICFGSIMVSFVQGVRSIHNIVKPKEDRECCDVLSSCLEFVLDIFDGKLDNINKWAYIYVGMYGYDFVEGGGNALKVFESKGWKTIVIEDICDNALVMTNISIGLTTGFVGMVLANTYELKIEEMGYHDPQLPGFFLAFLIGWFMSSIVMTVVSAAVNTVIVCFAESPELFEKNHPILSQDMFTTWDTAWPELV